MSYTKMVPKIWEFEVIGTKLIAEMPRWKIRILIICGFLASLWIPTLAVVVIGLVFVLPEWVYVFTGFTVLILEVFMCLIAGDYWD